MNDNIIKLRELTEKLHYLPELITSKQGDEVFYRTIMGECKGMGLLNIPECSVQEWIMPKGSTLMEHQHDITEYIILYQGKLKVTLNTDHTMKIIGPGDFFYTNPETPHLVEALEDSRGIGIAIPRSKGYPDVTR